jgi:hypothetical protein
MSEQHGVRGADGARPTVICLTPVKNESWILERFLACASLWADHILVAEQGSTDGSAQIAARFPKVTLIENPSRDYDEVERQRLLIDHARRIPGPRLLLALDADEALVADAFTSADWRRALEAPTGTALTMQWINVLPGARSAWLPGHRIPFGFVDDGGEHSGGRIHTPRVPVRPSTPLLHLDALKVLHFQYVDWARMQSKQRWYQCWESIHHPENSPIQVYRAYHHMDAVRRDGIAPFEPSWLATYAAAGIDLTDWRPSAGPLPWDEDVARWLVQYGARRFAKVDIWDVDWPQVARHTGLRVAAGTLDDPRKCSERLVHRFLRITQAHHASAPVRVAQRLLRTAGW